MTATLDPVVVRHSRRMRPSSPLIYVIACVVAALTIVPIIFVVVGGFRTTGQIADKP